MFAADVRGGKLIQEGVSRGWAYGLDDNGNTHHDGNGQLSM